MKANAVSKLPQACTSPDLQQQKFPVDVVVIRKASEAIQDLLFPLVLEPRSSSGSYESSIDLDASESSLEETDSFRLRHAIDASDFVKVLCDASGVSLQFNPLTQKSSMSHTYDTDTLSSQEGAIFFDRDITKVTPCTQTENSETIEGDYEDMQQDGSALKISLCEARKDLAGQWTMSGQDASQQNSSSCREGNPTAAKEFSTKRELHAKRTQHEGLNGFEAPANSLIRYSWHGFSLGSSKKDGPLDFITGHSTGRDLGRHLPRSSSYRIPRPAALSDRTYESSLIATPHKSLLSVKSLDGDDEQSLDTIGRSPLGTSRAVKSLDGDDRQLRRTGRKINSNDGVRRPKKSIPYSGEAVATKRPSIDSSDGGSIFRRSSNRRDVHNHRRRFKKSSSHRRRVGSENDNNEAFVDKKSVIDTKNDSGTCSYTSNDDLSDQKKERHQGDIYMQENRRIMRRSCSYRNSWSTKLLDDSISLDGALSLDVREGLTEDRKKQFVSNSRERCRRSSRRRSRTTRSLDGTEDTSTKAGIINQGDAIQTRKLIANSRDLAAIRRRNQDQFFEKLKLRDQQNEVNGTNDTTDKQSHANGVITRGRPKEISGAKSSPAAGSLSREGYMSLGTRSKTRRPKVEAENENPLESLEQSVERSNRSCPDLRYSDLENDIGGPLKTYLKTSSNKQENKLNGGYGEENNQHLKLSPSTTSIVGSIKKEIQETSNTRITTVPRSCQVLMKSLSFRNLGTSKRNLEISDDDESMVSLEDFDIAESRA